MKKTIITQLAVALFIIAPLAACNSSSEPAEEHGEEGEPAKGPHNGRLLKDGDFAVEMTIFEDGVPPQFRVYPTKDGKPVDAKTVQLTVTLKRLGGEVNTFPFKAEKDYLTGQGVVEEPPQLRCRGCRGRRRQTPCLALCEPRRPHTDYG